MTYGLNRYLRDQEAGEAYADWAEDQGLDPDAPETLALYEAEWEAQAEWYAEQMAARWDDDPSPYDGTYSEL